MSLISRLTARKYKLPPAITYQITHIQDIPIPMPDGVVLLADRYFPTQNSSAPTLLIRSPYGRRTAVLDPIARIFAERGFQVLVQSCRGTFGSGGKFFPFRDDRVDGLATLTWLKKQSWAAAGFAMFGPSYLSYVQWALADKAGSDLKALIPIVTASDFREVTSTKGAFALDTALSFAQGVSLQEESPLKIFLQGARYARRLAKAYKHLPLNQADRVAAGITVDFFQDWLIHSSPDDPWWNSMDQRAAVSKVTAPVHLIGGFYDVLFPQTLDCYRLLREAGQNPYMTLGPWTHSAPDMQPVMMLETLNWLRANMLDDRSGLRKNPVKLYVMGKNLWKEFAAWPPEGYPPQRWYLQASGGLAKSLPSASEPDRYRYDPNDPTPSIAGSSLTANSGSKDNRILEARKDVLLYTSQPLDQDLEVIGPLRVELYVKSSLQFTDFFARLCAVSPSGQSMNLSDGIVRLDPGRFSAAPGNVQKVEIELWPTANTFLKGQRIRVQVSSGAHPRFARNPGSGEPLASAATLIPADQQIFHDADHPSAIILPAKN